jgi:hypothetical protein
LRERLPELSIARRFAGIGVGDGALLHGESGGELRARVACGEPGASEEHDRDDGHEEKDEHNVATSGGERVSDRCREAEHE